MLTRKKFIIYVFITLNKDYFVKAYTNNLFNLIDGNIHISEGDCGGLNNPSPIIKYIEKFSDQTTQLKYNDKEEERIPENLTYSTVTQPHAYSEEDPFDAIQTTLNQVLFGTLTDNKPENNENPTLGSTYENIEDKLAHFPSGRSFRAELFQNKSGVHLPISKWMHRNHCYLNTTKDFMQTALNAFAILLEGTQDDVLRLPPMYVLRSARTIAMMKIGREKLTATWTVVKGDRETDEISYQTLEYYRPLFKYVSGREMARLNLMDDRILSFIGTHAELNRHQVGVIASKYIVINADWSTPKYLNLMNNLLCGVPMKFMRRIPEKIYLQLSHQLFYHIKACDPIQRRFFLVMMTRTMVLGKANSWNARDVARLGLLLAEVDGPDLASINPEAMVGVTAQVMIEMSAHNLKHLTKTQLRYLAQKPLNILTKKINAYNDILRILNEAATTKTSLFTYVPCFATMIIIIYKF